MSGQLEFAGAAVEVGIAGPAAVSVGVAFGHTPSNPKLHLGPNPLTPAASSFDAENYSPMQDMTCQPSHCECGAPFHRDGGYLFCSGGHARGIECVGREDHPRNAEWEAYLDANGRDAFERAIKRSYQRRSWR